MPLAQLASDFFPGPLGLWVGSQVRQPLIKQPALSVSYRPSVVVQGVPQRTD